MTVKDVYELFIDFKNNEFQHLEKRVDKIFWFALTSLLGIIGTLIAVLVR